MAHLTGHIAVPAGVVHAGDIVMAHGTGHVSGVLYVLCSNGVDRRRPIMTDFTESRGNQEMARHNQSGNHQTEDDQQASNLLGHQKVT
jgi:hypothetical protein